MTGKVENHVTAGDLSVGKEVAIVGRKMRIYAHHIVIDTDGREVAYCGAAEPLRAVSVT